MDRQRGSHEPHLPTEEGERFPAIWNAEDYQDQQSDTNKKAESDRAERQLPGTLVLCVLSPTKGQSKWQTGYQGLSSHNGSLRIHELGTNQVLQVNQRDVRELPDTKSFEEIDPSPGHTRDLSKIAPPKHVQIVPAVPTPLGTDVPVAADRETGSKYTTGLSRTREEWYKWCTCVHQCQMVSQN